jgi:hypothetical protein
MPLGPLGLLDTVQVSKDVAKRLAGMESYDLSFIRDDMLAKYTAYVPEDEVDTAIRELKRFLSLTLLVKNPQFGAFVPAQKVDFAWHEFILRTRQYREFCEGLVGAFVDHTPSETRSAGRAAAAGQLFYYTKQCLQQHFGPTPPYIWGIPNACDAGAACREPSRFPVAVTTIR